MPEPTDEDLLLALFGGDVAALQAYERQIDQELEARRLAGCIAMVDDPISRHYGIHVLCRCAVCRLDLGA